MRKDYGAERQCVFIAQLSVSNAVCIDTRHALWNNCYAKPS
jgi:hypothetical protein